MLVVQIQLVILSFVLKMNMFQTICVKHVPRGTTMLLGILQSGPDTVCDSVICSENYRVSDHECVICAPGTYNSGGDDASGPDTVCDIIQCAENEYVSNHMCQACLLERIILVGI